MRVTVIDLRNIRRCTPPHMNPRRVLDMVLHLNANDTPGISATELHELLACCGVCDLVMTRQTFQNHVCVMAHENRNADAVIDLTWEEDD